MRIVPYFRVSELDGLLRHFLSSGEGVRFVVPSRRDRNWWRVRAGRDAFGPDEPPSDILWNWQDLYENVCVFRKARRLRPIHPPDHRLILSRLLEGVLRENPALPSLWPGLVRAGFLDILSEDVRELLNEAVLPEQAESALSGENATAPVLPRIYRRYLEYLDENDLMDSAQLCTATLGLLDGERPLWGDPLTIVFVGFLSFTQAQVSLIRKLNALCREILVLKPHTALSDFHDAARQFALLAREVPPKTASGHILQLSVSESGLEAEAVARLIALWSAGKGPLAGEMDFPGFGSIGMMLPAGEEESVTEALNRYSVPHTSVLGVPIEQTLPGRALTTAWTLWNQGFPTYETALYLSQPCLAGDTFPVAEAMRAGPRGLASWKDWLRGRASPEDRRKGKRSSALGALSAVERFCRVLNRGGTPSELMEAFHRFLTEKGLWLALLAALSPRYPELDGAIHATASAIESVHEKFLALRELLPDIGPVGKTPLKGADAADFLKNWCRETRIRPELPLLGTVTLYPGPPPVLASYPVWVMLGVSQRDWPGPISGSPLLGADERERLAEVEAWLPSIQDKHVQREALFRRLVQTGENLTLLSRPETDENGRPLPETPFLDRFTADMGWSLKTLPPLGMDILLPSDGHLFSGIDAAPGDRLPRFVPSIGTDCETEPRHPPALAVSDLQALLECPLRYWLQRRAVLREHPPGLASAADWGSLAHKFWERVWRQFGRGTPPFSRIVTSEWSALASAEEEYGAFGRLIRDRRLARGLEILRFRVQRLAGLQERLLERLERAGFRHRSVLLEEDAVLSLETEGVRFSGRCDRVEILEDRDGRAHAVITDYKAGRSARYEEGMRELRRYPWHGGGPERLFRGLQLSAYALMYAPHETEAALAGVGFLGHQDGGLSGTFTKPIQELYAPELTEETRNDRHTLDERREEARYAMTCAARILKEGRFAPFYESPSCRYCGMRGGCRRGEVIGEAMTPEDDSADE